MGPMLHTHDKPDNPDLGPGVGAFLLVVLLGGLLLVATSVRQEKNPEIIRAKAIEQKQVFAFRPGESLGGVDMKFAGFFRSETPGLRVGLRDMQTQKIHYAHIPCEEFGKLEIEKVQIDGKPPFWITYHLTHPGMLFVQFHEP